MNQTNASYNLDVKYVRSVKIKREDLLYIYRNQVAALKKTAEMLGIEIEVVKVKPLNNGG